MIEAFTELSGSLRLMDDIVWRPCYPRFAILYHTDFWSFVGLLNQFSTSTSEVATFLVPLRSLLSTKISYYVQALMMKHSRMWKVPYYATSVVFLWNVTKPAHLSAASKQGLGFILQENFWVMDTDSGRISVHIRYRDMLS